MQCGTVLADDVGACPGCGEVVAVDEDPARRIGQVVGSYRIAELLGTGGMGFVYLAEHVKLGRKGALKMLRSEFTANPSLVRRFFAEARAVNQISHDHIV